MVLKTENFFKNRVLNSRIFILFAITFSVLIMGVLGAIALNYNSLGKTLKENQLSIMDTIYETTALLVANPVSLKFRYQEILLLLNQLRALV